MRVWVVVLLCSCPSLAWGYGYGRDEDPLLKAFQTAVTAAQSDDVAGARAALADVRWQLEELKQAEDLGVDLRPRLSAAHAEGATSAQLLESWANLLYLALLQKFHWNLREDLADYHKARARLESALAYYESALAGNVRKDDLRRRQADPKAPSRHEDVIAQFTAARQALGSPGLFGAGERDPDPAAFRAAVRRIAGHLKAVFPGFVHPGSKGQ